MRKILAVLMVVVMMVAAIPAVCVADNEISDFMQSLIEVAHMRMQQMKEEYDSKGELTDAQIEMAYSYLKLCVAAEHTKTVEKFYPLSSYVIVKADPATETEELVDEMWLKLLKGEMDKADFVKKLMIFTGVFLDD